MILTLLFITTIFVLGYLLSSQYKKQNNKVIQEVLDDRAKAYKKLVSTIVLEKDQMIVPNSYRELTQDEIIWIARAQKVEVLRSVENGLDVYIITRNNNSTDLTTFTI